MITELNASRGWHTRIVAPRSGHNERLQRWMERCGAYIIDFFVLPASNAAVLNTEVPFVKSNFSPHNTKINCQIHLWLPDSH